MPRTPRASTSTAPVLLSQTPLPAAPPVPASFAPLRRPKGTNLQVRPGPENHSTYRTPVFAPIHEMVILKGRDESRDGGGADPLQGLSCLFADVTVREEGASSRGGRGWSAVRRGRLAEGRVIGGRRGIRTGLRLADRANLAVFCWTQECGWCPMRVQESRTRSRTTRSTLIWEIRAEGYLRCCSPTGYPRSSITCSSAAMPERVAAGAGLGLHPS